MFSEFLRFLSSIESGTESKSEFSVHHKTRLKKFSASCCPDFFIKSSISAESPVIKLNPKSKEFSLINWCAVIS